MKTDNISEEILIDYIEGNLSEGEQAALEVLVEQTPALQKEIVFLKKTMLIPDEEIILPEKNSLKKNKVTRFKPLIYTASAVAAILIAVLYLMNIEKVKEQGSSITANSPARPVNPETPSTIEPNKEALAFQKEEKKNQIEPVVKKTIEPEKLLNDPDGSKKTQQSANTSVNELPSFHESLDFEQLPVNKGSLVTENISLTGIAEPAPVIPFSFEHPNPEVDMIENRYTKSRSGFQQFVSSIIKVNKEEFDGESFYHIHLNAGNLEIRGVLSFNQILNQN